MDFFTVLRERHSVRSFAERPVEPEKLQAVLEAANRAPSAGNLQAYEIYVVTRPAMLKALMRAAFEQKFVAQAPVVLVFCADPMRSARSYGERGATLYSVQDATIACAYAQLAATALGLGSVWVGAFRRRRGAQSAQHREGACSGRAIAHRVRRREARDHSTSDVGRFGAIYQIKHVCHVTTKLWYVKEV